MYTAIALPLPGPIMAIVVDKYHYTIPSFPIYFCMSQDPNFIFYSMILVLDILFALTIGLSFVLLWVVHKVYEPLAHMLESVL